MRCSVHVAACPCLRACASCLPCLPFDGREFCHFPWRTASRRCRRCVGSNAGAVAVLIHGGVILVCTSTSSLVVASHARGAWVGVGGTAWCGWVVVCTRHLLLARLQMRVVGRRDGDAGDAGDAGGGSYNFPCIPVRRGHARRALLLHGAVLPWWRCCVCACGGERLLIERSTCGLMPTQVRVTCVPFPSSPRRCGGLGLMLSRLRLVVCRVCAACLACQVASAACCSCCARRGWWGDCVGWDVTLCLRPS